MAALMFCGMLGAVIADRFRRRSEVAQPKVAGSKAAGLDIARSQVAPP
jgi:hypothetical protein